MLVRLRQAVDAVADAGVVVEALSSAAAVGGELLVQLPASRAGPGCPGLDRRGERPAQSAASARTPGLQVGEQRRRVGEERRGSPAARGSPSSSVGGVFEIVSWMNGRATSARAREGRVEVDEQLRLRLGDRGDLAARSPRAR